VKLSVYRANVKRFMTLARRTLALLAPLVLLPSPAFATWSVIAVDRSTGRMVLGSASCVNTNDETMKTLLAVIVPGKGVAACQAASDNTHANQMLVFNELQKGTDPKRIIELLSPDPNFQSRQFGILDLQGRNAGHTGLGNSYVAQQMYGQVPGRRFFTRSKPTPCGRAWSSRTPCRHLSTRQASLRIA
jgi:hypothetical protein